MALKPIHLDKSGDDHGGNCDVAKGQYPKAPEPWIDLSTGVNPHSYPLSVLPDKASAKLPSRLRLEALKQAAAKAYRISDPATIIAASGTQPIITSVMGMVAPGSAIVLGPTYSEHAKCAALAGHDVQETGNLDELRRADIAIVVNPNNPDGRLLNRRDLLEFSHALARRDGLLLIDEAFMDVAPAEFSMANEVAASNIVVLRSFGKFYGLPGLRLSFAVTSEHLANRLNTAAGPWPVSTPALEAGIAALNDVEWQSSMGLRLADDGKRLVSLLCENGLEIVGGTNLFQLFRHPEAPILFEQLCEMGILVRRFSERPELLRIGLPGDEQTWSRLAEALSLWKAGSAA